MSSSSCLALGRWFPRAGFRWQYARPSKPLLRILRNKSRNAVVQRAIVSLFEPGTVVGNRDARRVVNRALEATVDGLEGIGPDEDIVDFLGRAAQSSDLGRALEEDVWVELVYQIVFAREKYMREASDEEKKGNQDRMTAMAWLAEELLQEAGDH